MYKRNNVVLYHGVVGVNFRKIMTTCSGVAQTRDDNGSGRTITYPPVKRLRVKIRTCTCRISNGYRIPVGFIILHIKITSK
jgi:hypothetical protein